METVERLRLNMDVLSLRAVAQKTNIKYPKLRQAVMYAKTREVLSIAETERLEGFLVLRGKSLAYGSDNAA